MRIFLERSSANYEDIVKLDQTIETIQTWFCALMFIMILILVRYRSLAVLS